MWQFIIPTLISAVGGAVSSGTQARQAERQNQMAADAAATRRTQLQGLIDSISQTDYRGLERAGSAQFSQASDQIEALTAGRGTFGAGSVGARNLQTQALSDMLTTLAAQKNQDELQRQQMVAGLMSDQAFYTPHPSAFNPSGAGMMAALGGGAAGLASGAASFFGTDVGQAWLAGLGAPKAPVAPGAMPQFGVQNVGAAPAAEYGGGYGGGMYAPAPQLPVRNVGPVAWTGALPPGGHSPMAWRPPVQSYVNPWFQMLAP